MKKIITAIAAIPLMLGAMQVAAQNNMPGDANYYTYERLASVNPWLAGSNPAGLVFNPVDISSIDLFYGNENGGFRNVWEAKTVHSFGLSTQSYKKVGKVNFYGKMGFDYAYQNEKGWAANIYPWTTPMIIADDITGQQRRERYNIAAGMSVPIGEKFAFGASGSYWGISNGKQRDARNENKYMELEATPAILFKSRMLNLGLSATYGRKTEYINYSTHGSLSSPFIYAFRGMWFATSELPKEFSDKTYIDAVWKGSFQAELIFTPYVSWFNEFSMEYREQVVEEGRTSNKGETFGSYDKLNYDYKGMLVINGCDFDHNVTLEFKAFDMLGYTDIYVKEAVEGTNSEIIISKGRIRDYSEKYIGFGAGYKLFAKRTDWNSSWYLSLGAEYFKWDKTYYIFPTEYSQQIKNTKMHAAFNKNLLFRFGTLDVKLGAAYTIGGGVMNDIKVPEGAREPAGALAQQMGLLEKYYHYMAGDRLDLDAVIRYNHFLNKITGMRLYCEAAYNFATPLSDVYFNPRYIYRHTTKVSVGLNF